MAANINMENGEQRISLQSATNRRGRPGALNINMKGLDIASLLSSWPLAPPIAGNYLPIWSSIFRKSKLTYREISPLQNYYMTNSESVTSI